MLIKQTPEDFIVEEIPEFLLERDAREYALYRLKKKGLNTEQAVDMLSKRLKIERKRIKYAGNKDKNASTTQYISIHKDNGRHDVQLDNLSLEFLGFSDEPLSLGSLKGNSFIITLRSITKDELDRFMNAHEKLIPNYFDEQRFSRNNFDTGLSILKNDYKKACGYIMESEGLYEDKMRSYLEINRNDYVGALKLLPKKIITLYLHAVQSLLFNEALADMLKEYAINNSIAYKELEYGMGTFIFYDHYPMADTELPLIGFDTNLLSTRTASRLKELGISQRDFIIKSMPEISLEGSARKCLVALEQFSYELIDEQTVRLRFSLLKGSYATIALKALFN